MTLNIKASGGTFLAYLRPSSDAFSPPPQPAPFYAVEFANGTACSGTLSVYKTVSASVNLLAQSAEPCKDGMTLRASRGVNWMVINCDLGTSLLVGDTHITTGNPGYGAHDLAAGNGIANAL